MTRYNSSNLRPRWLHIGFGAFARAHPLFTLHRGLMADASGDWGAIVARLHSGADELDALDGASGRYHVIEADADSLTATQVRCIIGTCHPARDGASRLAQIIALPDMAVVSLTITEKGYCLGPDNGLDMDHPTIKHDLTGKEPARSAIGILVDGLKARRAAGHGGLTIISCDNLSENGDKLRSVVLDYASASDVSLRDWIVSNARFPNSMVDRIVPAMTVDSHADVTAHLGHTDPTAVLCEPFLQWVIEDDFATAPPPLAAGGALLVSDVAPYEAMKLRMLNGAHTCLALLGGQAGIATIDGCMRDAVFEQAIRNLHLHEVVPTLPPVPGIDLKAYSAQLLARFANPRLQHQTAQIASDTSKKLPQRILAPLRWHLDQSGTVPPLMALVLASWLVWLLGQGDNGDVLPFNDPAADDLRHDLRNASNPVATLLSFRPVFPQDLADDPRVSDAIGKAFADLRQNGARSALTAFI